MTTPDSATPDEAMDDDTEGLPGRRLLVVYVLTVVIGLAGVAFSGWLLVRSRHARGTPDPLGPGHDRVAPRAIGLIEQTSIEQTAVGRSLDAQKRRDLERFGWVDRTGGVARIPIDRAMDVVADEPGRR